MLSFLNPIDNIKSLICNTKHKSTEPTVDLFNGEVQMFDKYGYGKNGDFNVNVCSYYFRKVRYNQNKMVTDVNYKDII